MTPHVPVELLAHIVSFLGDDRIALRNVCLSTRALHAVSFRLLFGVRDFRALGAPYLEPFLRFLHELRISWKPDMHGGKDGQVFSRLLTPYLSSSAVPCLQKLTIRGISTDGMTFLNGLHDSFKAFDALTTLDLNETCHRNMRDVQILLCAFPRLAHLRLNAMTWTSPEFNECDDEPELFERPALKSLRVSPIYPACMLPLLRWLARTPSARTLSTLDVPIHARIGPDALPHFGPSVRQLSVPLRGLTPNESLTGYVTLASLTLYVRIDDLLMRSYERLPDIIETLPTPAALHELEIHIPYEAAVTLVGPLDALKRVDDILFGAGPRRIPVDTKDAPRSTAHATSRFNVFTEVRVVLLSTTAPSEETRADAAWATRLHMPRAGALGRLSVRFGRDDRGSTVMRL
ncbi:hypothetical protein C8Q77DRAFT_1072292 [Trametes polyzona]|nr:hypothetical protein C8Q77DRAFT_1072292 [Trametes polyzona]